MMKTSHPKTEQTLVIIKPDGIQRTLVGEIIGRYERLGLKLVGLKMLLPSAVQIEEHYLLDPNWKRLVGEKAIESYLKKGEKPPSADPIVVGGQVIMRLKKYFTSGPVVASVWQGAHAVEIVRKITGGTEPRSSDVGTIRGDFVLDSYSMADTDDRAIRNLIHASGSVAEAEAEIKHWFSKDELVKYRLVQEQILYDVNLDGLLE
ncbi:MAG: nucleoside-diphosphate kinase [Parcubacteria group bacterium Gr01-1014_72]|nr:MAG: nucleoside-diphosphate kinase [Parcubacteria group bacterium Gr01-1014_72]